MARRREAINPAAVANTLCDGFSQAVSVEGGRRVLLSGQVGVDGDARLVGEDLAPQAGAALDNIATILSDQGGGLDDVVFLRLYLAEAARYEQEDVRRVLRERFPLAPPASSWCIVRGLAEPEWLIEIVAEAVI